MELAEYRRMAEVEDVHWWYRSTRALLQQLLAGSLAPGGRFLDVGCGTGATGGWLGERGDLVAVDFELQALSRCSASGTPRSGWSPPMPAGCRSPRTRSTRSSA